MTRGRAGNFRNPTRRLAAGLLALAVAAAAAPAPAAVVLIDFNDAQSGAPGSGVPPSNTTTVWNTVPNAVAVSAGASQGLVDSTGQASGITLRIDDAFASSGLTNAGIWSDDPGNPAWVDLHALGDYFLLDNGNQTGRIAFTGLDPSLTYQVDLVGSRSASGTRIGDYLIQGQFADNGSLNYDAYADGYLARKVMTWVSVSPTYNGVTDEWEIVLDMAVKGTGSSRFAYLSAGQITVVAEPATMTILAIGGLTLVMSAVRRRRAA